MESWIIALVLGGVAGWLGGQLFKGSGLGIIGNIVVGIIGGLIGSWLFGTVLGWNFGGGWLGYIITAALGSVILLAVLNLVMKKR